MKRWRRTVVHGLLVAFAVWPAAQIGLVWVYDVNPWKLAGWGMYSAPQIPPYTRIICLTPDETGEYELSTIPEELEPTHLKLLSDRLALGKLAKPDRLARQLRDHYPAIDGVIIEIVHPVLNRRTGIIEDHPSRYEYPRP